MSQILRTWKVAACWSEGKDLPCGIVARGYIIGSGWRTTRARSLAAFHATWSAGQPGIFTPSTKADIRNHDENISFDRAVNLVGRNPRWLRDETIELYLQVPDGLRARDHYADTKFEFGLVDGVPTLVDEVLTPDSSRFWPMDEYRAGISPPSLDKQFVRDYLEGLAWNKKPPAPALPAEIISKTRAKYLDIYRILTGSDL
jgi:phosphoribosylaminoimidazole-succinocarboxamide synthase